METIWADFGNLNRGGLKLLPKIVDETMRKLCSSLHTRLLDNLESVYVYGSTALGAYIEGTSDIDFLILVRRPLSQSEILAISEAHEEVEKSIPGTDIMGSYIRREDLGKSFIDIPVYATYYNKKLQTNGEGADINPITLWVLRRHGICVFGEELPFVYDTLLDELLKYVLNNMNTYWVSWIDRLENKLETTAILNQTEIEQIDYAVEWCILGMLRQLYTIKESDITSKIGAGEYGLKILPKQWHELIREAIAIKRQEPIRIYSSQETRLKDLVELLQFIHTECNRHFEKLKF
jgi:predicted nucleotidyltransferase